MILVFLALPDIVGEVMSSHLSTDLKEIHQLAYHVVRYLVANQAMVLVSPDPTKYSPDVPCFNFGRVFEKLNVNRFYMFVISLYL